MRARQVIGLVLVILDLPVLFIGLIDPLEGGIALLFGLIVGVAARLVSSVPVPRFSWIAIASTFAVGILALVIAIFTPPVETVEGVANPVLANTALRILVWVYRLGVLATLAGAVWYAARIVQAMRKPEVTVG